MSIIKLDMRGIKEVQDQSFALFPLTLIQGSNTAGKTSLLDAITVGLTGYLPRLGRRNQDTWLLAGADSMGVRITMSDGTTRQRDWFKGDNGVSIKSSGTVEFDANAIDLRAFHALTEAGRVQYLAEQCRAEPDFEAVLAQVREIQPALRAVTEQFTAFVDECAASVSGTPLGQLVKLKELFAGAVRLHRAGSKSKSATMTELRDQPDVSGLKERLKKLEADAEALVERGRLKAELEKLDAAPVPLERPPSANEEAVDKADIDLTLAQAKKAESDAALKSLALEIERQRGLIREMEGQAVCPHCGSSSEWETFVQKQAGILELAIGTLCADYLEREREAEDLAADVAHFTAKLEAEKAALKSWRDWVLAESRWERRKEIIELLSAPPPDDPTAEIATVLNRLEERETWDRCRAQRLRIESELVTAGVMEEACSRAHEVCQAALVACVRDSIGVVLKDVTEFTAGILEGSPAYEDGRFGLVRGGKFIAAEVLSGSEDLVLQAGLRVACVRSNPFRLVMLDEVGRLTQEVRERVLARLAHLHATGRIDQAILVEAGTPDIHAPWVAILR